MTPIRAKRNSKAPERFSSDETKVDTSNSHANSEQGDKSKSATKSTPSVREPLKVKLPRLKRPQSAGQPQIKVKISRVGGTNRNFKAGSPASKAKPSSEISVNGGHLVSKNAISNDGKHHDSSKRESYKSKDLKITLPVKGNSGRRLALEHDLGTKHDGSSEFQSADDQDASRLDDLDSSLGSKDSDESAMKIVVERRNDSCNTGIRCPCGIDDDIGIMVECEKCSTWQHGHCINVGSEEDAYEGYQCGYCSFPTGRHTESLRQLTVGDKFQTKFDLLYQYMHDEIRNHENGKGRLVVFTLDEIEQAVKDVMRVIKSFKVKCKMLNSDDYPNELKIWRHPIWSDNPEEYLTEQQKQSVTFIGDVFKHNLRLHLSNLLSKLRRRCTVIRFKLAGIEMSQKKFGPREHLLSMIIGIHDRVNKLEEEIRQKSHA